MTLRSIEGQHNAAGLRFGIIAARWNTDITQCLIEGALSAILEQGGVRENITLVRVPGSFEIPLACRELARSGEFDALIAVGTLIQGKTDHYRLVAEQLAAGLCRVMLETGLAVTFGVITSPTRELAVERAGEKSNNQGFQAALAAIEMADLLKKLRRQGQ